MFTRRELLTGGLALIGSKIAGIRVLSSALESVKWGVHPDLTYPFEISLLDKGGILIPNTGVEVQMSEASDFNGLVYPRIDWTLAGDRRLVTYGWSIGKKEVGVIGKFTFVEGLFHLNPKDTLTINNIQISVGEFINYNLFKTKMLGIFPA